MYCVIQKIVNKKPVQSGYSKELLVDWTTMTYQGKTETKYSYRYSDERFERPIKDAYKISIHKSYRENGKVKKKQWVICTMSYYNRNPIFILCGAADLCCMDGYLNIDICF
jgi:hypothetical protein